MLRARWMRAVSALVAIVFSVFTTEALVLHPCPMHDAVAFTYAAGHAHGAMSAHAAHAAPHADHGTPAQHGDQETDGHGGHGCSCPGTCTAGAALALPSSGIRDWPVVVALARAHPWPAQSHAPEAAAHLLPFANGPPRVA